MNCRKRWQHKKGGGRVTQVLSSPVQQVLAAALQHFQAGRLGEAERLFRQVLANDPHHTECLHLLGLIAYRTGRNDLAIDLIGNAIEINPNFADALSNYGNIAKALGRLQLALESYDKALAIKPGESVFHFNRGNTLQSLNRPIEALASYNRAVALNPDNADALFSCAEILINLRRFEEALRNYDRLLAVRPDHADAWNNRGNALQRLQRFEEALASYERSLTLKPDYAEVWNNCGNILHRLKRFEEALASYDRALAIRPDSAGVLNNRAITLRYLNQLEKSLASSEAALVLQPDNAEALSNRGFVLRSLERFEEALGSYDKALAIRPDYASALYNRGVVLDDLEHYDKSLASYEKLLTIDPEHSPALNALALLALKLCDWPRTAELTDALAAKIAAQKPGVHPFVVLGYFGVPSLHRECARNYIQDRIQVRPRPLWDGTAYRHDKICIAYMSSDFRQHPVAFQIVQMLELHDRSRFEVLAISTGRDDRSEIRGRLIRAFDQFHDLQTQSDRAAAEFVRRQEVDILIDLNGHTQGARPEILSYRPAPVQVNFFGYAGTIGADFVDYVIADLIVVPFDQQSAFTERIVHLPDSYFVSDAKRTIGAMPTRREAGLPDQGFVFCTFNQNWKITAPVFAIWMRLLGAVAGSVLWLKDCNEGARNNLRHEAKAHGIDPQRLIFADRVALDVHLARHLLADLFLDTLPYNAHATASDALWAGLPLITCRGESFAGRVAASLLHAVGLSELVTNSLEDYEALALKLAYDRALLNSIRQKLAQNRLTAPLFDTDRYSRNIEAAYTRMWEFAQSRDADGFTSVSIP